jgi:CDP-diacylglycerol--glycerol-3-phosphate 3-phosphatidyltransferase
MMAANIITLGRILLVFAAICLFQAGFEARLFAVALTVFVICLDALDGIVARKLGTVSDFGALFDITGDRIVEHIFLIFFSAAGVLSFWVPVVFVTRSFLVDTLRSVAYSKEGKTPFGGKTMMKSPISRFLTASRFSRATYGVSKVVVFVLLGLMIAFQKEAPTERVFITESWVAGLEGMTILLVWVMVIFNLVRGIPVLWDGRYYLFDKSYPRELKEDA